MKKRTYIKYVTAAKCPCHQAITKVAVNFLLEKDYFSKNEVLIKSGMEVVGDSIRWEFIAQMIHDPDGDWDGCESFEVIPITPRFWNMTPELLREEAKRKGKSVAEITEVHAMKCIAGGHSGKAEGYALVCDSNHDVVRAKLEHRRNTSNGVGRAFDRYSKEVAKRNLLEKPEQHLLTRIS